MPKAHRILLADAVAMFRELGQIFLSRSGPVDLADSGEAALRIAARRPPAILIADMHLPDVPGAELCRRFKQDPASREMPVILLARPEAPSDHAAAVRAGADEVLFKPLERDTLISSVRRLTDYDVPRGLPRAQIERPIEITTRGRRFEGVLRNVSRGGVFVDAPIEIAEAEEVGLTFSLDGQDTVVAPTARVVWSRHEADGPEHIGLRFLEIDARTIEKLDHYVSDHYPSTQSVPA